MMMISERTKSPRGMMRFKLRKGRKRIMGL